MRPAARTAVAHPVQRSVPYHRGRLEYTALWIYSVFKAIEGLGTVCVASNGEEVCNMLRQ